jgi:glycosyltransferase involved in cell wall biosynthesis
VSNKIDLAPTIRQNDLGLLFPEDPREAVQVLANALNEPSRLTAYSEKARAYAQENFRPEIVASKYLDLYRAITQIQ